MLSDIMKYVKIFTVKVPDGAQMNGQSLLAASLGHRTGKPAMSKQRDGANCEYWRRLWESGGRSNRLSFMVMTPPGVMSV